MATITKNKSSRTAQLGGTPYGNQWGNRFQFYTAANGSLPNSDSTAAVGNGDVVRLGILPIGLEIQDSLAIVSAAFTASTTAKLGFAYVDGVDDATVPQDDDYFNAALSTAAAGRTRANNTAVAPVKLPKDAYLILTVGGAAHASAGKLDFFVYGESHGQP